jgi:hypothetical protein
MTLTIVLLTALLGSGASAGTPPPRNPFLADSSNSIGHGDPAQQDSVPQPGPDDPGPRLGRRDIDYAHVGPAHFGANTSGRYPDGRRVMWSNGLDRIVKIDHDSFEVLATYEIPGVKYYGEARADASIAKFDASNDGFFAFLNGAREVLKLRDLSGVYTLLDADHVYYIGDKDGGITAYADADPRDPASPIVKKRSFQLPEGVTGLMIGMNMTFDGWLVTVTEHGYVVAVEREFSEYRVLRMKHSEGAEDKATGRSGYGWVRNGFAIDERGGIYIVSQEHMHKVVWTGEKLSSDESDGAWTARYLNGWGHGSGATPSLMGFGDEDRFVVITDGQPLMNVTLFWRDAIPAGWQALEGAPDRRIAGMLPANMGNPELETIQSEQSVVVAGHGALVVNNIPRGVPWYVPRRLEGVFISYLGSNPCHQPFGVQKFQWNSAEQRFEEGWVNREISSPSCVPIVSRGNDRIYLIGARDDRWTLEALDWHDGQSVFHSVIGGQRYNPLYSGTLIDEAGRIHYGTPWGRVRLAPTAQGER